MIKQISIKTKFGWISAFEEKGKIVKVKFGETRKKSISNKRRTILKGSAAGASAAALGFPSLFLPTAASAAPWIKKSDDTIKVGLLWSTTGNLAVIETDSTMVGLYAIDEINAAGGVAGKMIEPVVVDARSDIKVYSEKISQLILNRGLIILK